MYKIISSVLVMATLFFVFFILHSKPKLKKATFGGGCFWCMEPPFEKLEGVKEVLSGYTGGDEVDPTYEQVSRKQTGHLEAIQVIYDPQRITYKELLDVFWKNIDPTDEGGQFVDRGPQYAAAVFYHDNEQKKIAEKSKADLERKGKFKKIIVTPILEAKAFYNAEDYHQDFYKKSTARYKSYRVHSGRDQFIKKVWGKDMKKKKYNIPLKEELEKILTSLQFHVTQENGTEKAFDNEYWNNYKPGIYVDVVSGEPLFSSRDKFKSGSGWPSFTKPLEPDNIKAKIDVSHVMSRTEVRSTHSDSHLGHVFKDGPEPTGLRYCINSAALIFIPVEDLKKKGHEKYIGLFR